MKNSNDKLRVLITATTWWSLSARLSSRLLGYGCKVTALCPPGHPLRFLQGIVQCYPYKTFRTQASLAHAIRESRPDYVVPTDDQAVQQFQQLAMVDTDVRALYERSMGSLESGLLLAGRGFLSQQAARLGIARAESCAVESLTQARDLAREWGYPVVLKKDGTWGGNGVCLLRHEDDLAPAYAKLVRPITFAARSKRRLVNSDRLAFANSNSHGSELTLQRYVDGTPANAMFAVSQGKLLADYQVRVCASQGPTGAALLVEQVRDPRIRAAGARLAAELKLSGFFGLDFVLRKESDEPVLIELNPRTTQLGHLPMRDGSDLAGHMYAAWTDSPLPLTSEPNSAARIAFFPQAMQSDMDAQLLQHAYMDVPQEPALTAELQKTSWPERQWLARAYHALRRPGAPACHVYTAGLSSEGPLQLSATITDTDKRRAGSNSQIESLLASR